MAKDFYHENFKEALERDGWRITHDPYPLRIGNIGYEIDYGAEKLIAAEKSNKKIAVELKGFTGPSDVNEFHKAVGQFNDYFVALEMVDPERVLYLAIPEETWFGFFQEAVIQKAIKRIEARVIVFDPGKRTISLWIK